ncbi:MAG: hypothetical protein WA213_21605 [Terriglobales bacterium]
MFSQDIDKYLQEIRETIEDAYPTATRQQLEEFVLDLAFCEVIEHMLATGKLIGDGNGRVRLPTIKPPGT